MTEYYTIVIKSFDTGMERIMATPPRLDTATLIMDSYKNDSIAAYEATLFDQNGYGIRSVISLKRVFDLQNGAI